MNCESQKITSQGELKFSKEGSRVMSVTALEFSVPLGKHESGPSQGRVQQTQGMCTLMVHVENGCARAGLTGDHRWTHSYSDKHKKS